MNGIFPDLASVLGQLIKEAESPDGVTGDCARAAYKAETVSRAQLSDALERILRELHDDGITEAALNQARQAIGWLPATSESTTISAKQGERNA
jgi:hypothetical protein